MYGQRWAPPAAARAPGSAAAKPKAAPPPPADGNQLVTFDAQLAKQQEKAEIEKHRGGPKEVAAYTGPKVKWEDTGLYKAMVRSQDIEEELTKIRNLIRKRTDPHYEPDDDDFNVQPAKKFDVKTDYYKLLDIDDFASIKDIKGAYKKMALQFHPDKNRDKKPDELLKMQEQFEQVQMAYEVLSDRPTRRQYDRAKFDEARAKSQGMNSNMYSEKTGGKNNFWGRWMAKKEREAKEGKTSNVSAAPVGKATRVPKAPDLKVEMKISLDKSLRGGMKIREVRRDRIQRSFGQATQMKKNVHVQINPGQADGSEYRIDGDGNWPSVGHTPGDLVFVFRHKPHQYLRQVGSPGDGHLQLAAPLVVRAKAMQRTVSAWTPTFKGQMLLARFLNPLLLHAPSKACTVTLRVDGEGLPVEGDASKRGSLSLTVTVQLEGEALMPCLSHEFCKDTLMRRHVRRFNHQPALRAELAAGPAALADMPVRTYTATSAKERDGRRVELPAVITVWEAPAETDPVVFAKAACALGFQAQQRPDGYGWCFHRGLVQLRLSDGSDHHTLRDEDIASDEEEDDFGPVSKEAKRQADHGVASAPSAPRRRRVLRARPGAEAFMMRLGLAPPDGFPDPASTDEEGEPTMEVGRSEPSRPASRPKPASAAKVQLNEVEQEGKEEQDLTKLIRQKQNDMEKARRKWSNRKARLKNERDDEEGTLRDLLEKDKAREYERIDREMNGLRSNFEYQLNAEKKWVEEFTRDHRQDNKWVCVFKPSMVARQKPLEEGPVARRIMLDEVVQAKGPATDDHWVQLTDGAWALTWHQKHGQLLQKWFGADQSKFLEIEKKIGERRKVRNQTFIDYRRKKKEVAEWCIPPGPTDEELFEIEDEESEHLHNVMEPFLKEIKEMKRRLRELRQKRVEAAAARSRKEAGGSSLAGGQLPAGFVLDDGLGQNGTAAAEPQASPAPASSPTASEQKDWEVKKQAADKAFKEKDWNTAVSLYGEALKVGGTNLDETQTATLLSNRSLMHSKLGDWQQSLSDATDATIHNAEWPKGWLRRATAELRLDKNREALASLKKGMCCAAKVAGQFLPLITECEAALYNDKDNEAPDSATGRIEKFREEGTRAFEQGHHGVAILFFTRSLYHRAMMSVEANEEAIVLSNRSASFLKLGLANEALADALASNDKHPQWSKPLVRAGQAALLLDDFKSAYQYYAKARRLDEHYKMASDGLNDCLQKIIKWEYPAATRRWSRFVSDRRRPRDGTRVWALSDVYFDSHGVPEWCKSLSSSFFRDDVLMLAGNLADSLPQLRFALTVLKSKFRRVFYVPGNHDLWIRRVTLQTIIKGEKVKDEQRDMVDSVSKLLEVLKVCDDLGVETAPAEIAAGVFIVPMFSWYSRDFISREIRKEKASERDEDLKITIDQWIKWPFPCGSDDAWKFFMRMNEAPLRAVLASKLAFERFADQQAVVLTMTHFLTRPEQDIDWTVPGIWDYIGCEGLDEQIRTIGSDCHVYGHACVGPQKKVVDGLPYVHNYIGTTEKHRVGMAPYCILDRGQVMPHVQPSQKDGFNFQPLERPKEEEPRRSGG